ncbi:MAG: Gfo/Idh/MocA family oxidoreductase [Verrucomicrobiae bacterium]|nr:Gfo/Idh/MocA family oxidoreductase [Verrucomicrobiae bacterium]
MQPLRVGILGQGRSGWHIHAHLVRQLPGLFTLAAVADPIKERREEAIRATGCAAHADYRGLLKRKDLNLVVNALASHLHVPVTKEALRAGHAVLCEKPLARRAKDADDVIRLAKQRRKFFAVFQQSRFAPYFRKVREVLASGVLGRAVMVKIAFNGFARRWDWQTLQENMAGNLLNTGPHPLDQALQIFGGNDMPKVFCLMDRANTFGNAEDHVKLILHGKGRPTMDLEISSCCAYPTPTYQIYGTRGGLTATPTRAEWKYYRPKEAPRQRLLLKPTDARTYCSEQLPWHTGLWEADEEEKNLFDYMGLRFYRNLHAAITRSEPLEVPPEQVRRQIAVIEECHRQCPLPKAIAQPGK